MMHGMNEQHEPPPTPATASYPRYVVAALRDADGGYVVYDRWDERVADGRYLSLDDAQWAADQRNRQQWQTTARQATEGGSGV